MGAHEADEESAGVVVIFYDESVMIAFDVEHHPVSRQAIGTAVLCLDFGKRLPRGLAALAIPRPQRLFERRVSQLEIPELFEWDNVHTFTSQAHRQ